MTTLATAASRPRRRTWALALLSALALALATAVAEPGDASAHGRSAPKPTIVLVHGAFADASGWTDVQKTLQAKGYTVWATANPLRGIASDAETLRLFLSTIEGPIVLVGHSYGGAVVTNAATGNPDVEALVYIAAYAPDEGETLLAVNELGGGHTEVGDHLIGKPYPGAPENDFDGYIDPAWFPRLFAQDVPLKEATALAYQQRPAAASALVTPSGPPAWTSIPSWYLVAKQDRIIPPEAQRVMADRMGATTTSVNSSHVPFLSKPDAVVRVILDAARSVR